MRVYLPSTLPLLRGAVAAGVVQPEQDIGFAVTEGLRAEYGGADTEDLEYLAMHDAALASLRLIAGSDADPVRVVIAVDAEATARGDLDRAAVTITEPVPWRGVASVHIDGGDAAKVIRAAADVVHAADLGDSDAAIVLGDAEDIDLAWYAPGEIGYLLTELAPPE